MALAQEDIEQIQQIVKQAIEETPELGNANVRYEMDLRERTIRVEEELKHQRELMLEGFKQMEKRFEQVDKRFEQIDKRLEFMERQFEIQHREIMNIHQEIKALMRWGFGTIVAVGGLIVAVLKLA